jgi:hypothetical protein
VSIDGWTTARLDTVTFSHPDSWAAETHEDADGTTVYLQSEAVAFGIVALYSEDVDPQDAVEQAMDSLREEHPGLELDPMDLDDRIFADGVAHEGLFMTLDTVAYCWIQSWRIAGRCALVFMQSVEKESADCEEAFFRICRSFEVAPGGSGRRGGSGGRGARHNLPADNP